jgi:lipoprotein-anchoring transpeptidase ErfK/SrfK
MVSRRAVVASGMGVAAGLAVAGCSDSSSPEAGPRWSEGPSSSGGPSASDSPPASAASVTITPAAAVKNVSPRQQVVVAVEGGTLQKVTVTAAGKAVAGDLDTDQTTWRSTGKLSYGKTYAVKVSAVDSSGVVTQKTSSFSTVKPAGTAAVTFQANALASIKDGGTYGVGQTVIVAFSKRVKDKDAAEKVMEVVAEPAVEGRWRWVDSQTAVWRPAKYWAAGTRITVRVKALGVNLGGGVYGARDASVDFRIGPSRIAVADSNTKMMKVYINGKLVRTIPISMGKGGTTTGSRGQTIDFWTRSGPHVVMTTESSHRMTSASFGITDEDDPNFYDEVIKLCHRLTYSGEFTHMADWNVPDHGRRNTSHGCINIGPAHAQWFYDTFKLGDVVDVRNTPRQMQMGDGVGGFWTVAWNKW